MLLQEKDIKKALIERQNKLRNMLNDNEPRNPQLVEAHIRRQSNINAYICEINDLFSAVLNDPKYDDIRMGNKRELDSEMKDAMYIEDIDNYFEGDFVNVYRLTKNNSEYDYLVIVIEPFSSL